MSIDIDTINEVRSKKVCRVQVFNNGDVSIGFGEKIYHNKKKLRDNYYGEWEIGTFHNNWKLCRSGVDLCRGVDLSRKSDEAESVLVKFLSESSLLNISTTINGSVEISFSNGVMLKVEASNDEEDESFHMFCPNDIVWDFRPRGGWRKMNPRANQ